MHLYILFSLSFYCHCGGSNPLFVFLNRRDEYGQHEAGHDVVEALFARATLGDQWKHAKLFFIFGAITPNTAYAIHEEDVDSNPGPVIGCL